MGKLDCVAVLRGHLDCVWSVAWHPSGNIIASCSADKTIKLWQKRKVTQSNNNSSSSSSNVGNSVIFDEEWICFSTLKDGHSKTIRSVAWSPCGEFLASSSFDATTCVWDKVNGEYDLAATLEGHENEIKGVTWSKSGEYLSTCSRDKSVWIWAVEKGNEFECLSVLNEHSHDVKSVVWHPQVNILMSTSYDDTIKLYKESDEDDDWECFTTLSGHESTVWNACFSSNGEQILSCGDDRSIKVWHSNNSTSSEPSYQCVATVSGHHNRPIYSIDYNKDSTLIATGSGDNGVRVFSQEMNVIDGKSMPILSLEDTQMKHQQDVNCVTWSPVNDSILASCSDDRTVRVWQFNGIL